MSRLKRTSLLVRRFSPLDSANPLLVPEGGALLPPLLCLGYTKDRGLGRGLWPPRLGVVGHANFARAWRAHEILAINFFRDRDPAVVHHTEAKALSFVSRSIMMRSTFRAVVGDAAARRSALERFDVGCLERGLGRRGMMMMAPKKLKKGRSGKALDQKTATLLKLLDAKPTPM